MYTYIKSDKIIQAEIRDVDEMMWYLSGDLLELYNIDADEENMEMFHNDFVMADETGHYELNFYLHLDSVPRNFRNDLQSLVEKIEKAFEDNAEAKFFTKVKKDSIISYYNEDENYSANIAITMYNTSGPRRRLIWEKGKYELSKSWPSHKTPLEDRYIRSNDLIDRLRAKYLENRNRCPEQDPYIAYIEAKKEVYNNKPVQ